jgi:hypothetical protein
MAVVEEKLGMDPRIGQPEGCGLGQKSFFSGGGGAVDPFNSVDDLMKVYHVRECPQEAYE